MGIGISLLSQGAEQFTGTSRYVTELLREFASMPESIDVEVLCNETAAAETDALAATNIQVTRAEGYRPGRSRLGRALTMARGMARPGPLARQFSSGVSAVQYPLIIPLPRVGAPMLVNLHDIQHRDHPELFSRPQLWWRKLAYDRAARRASLVLTLSEHSRQKIIHHLGVAAERVIAIPLAIDPGRFNPEAEPGEAARLARYELPERFLFYPASLWPHKNHERLLEAVAQLDDEELGIVLSGAPFGRLDELMATARSLGLEGRVVHVGFIPEEDLPAIYRRATALAFPSMYEGFGTPPLEAMACGCPVASSYATSLSEVCGDAALELIPDDPDQMAQALARVIRDDAIRSELRRKGLERVRSFSWRQVALRHLDAYRRAIEQPAGE